MRIDKDRHRDVREQIGEDQECVNRALGERDGSHFLGGPKTWDRGFRDAGNSKMDCLIRLERVDAREMDRLGHLKSQGY